MKKPLPKCPYCGTDMILTTRGFYFYQCPIDETESPPRMTADTAYEAANIRWVEPNRVLDLRELMFREEPVGIEIIVNDGYIGTYCDWYLADEARDENLKEYNTKWRAWLRKPTEFERENVKWNTINT